MTLHSVFYTNSPFPSKFPFPVFPFPKDLLHLIPLLSGLPFLISLKSPLSGPPLPFSRAKWALQAITCITISLHIGFFPLYIFLYIYMPTFISLPIYYLYGYISILGIFLYAWLSSSQSCWQLKITSM
jgi:hypothetical protein